MAPDPTVLRLTSAAPHWRSGPPRQAAKRTHSSLQMRTGGYVPNRRVVRAASPDESPRVLGTPHRWQDQSDLLVGCEPFQDAHRHVQIVTGLRQRTQGRVERAEEVISVATPTAASATPSRVVP
jgi:hypothetical protein